MKKTILLMSILSVIACDCDDPGGADGGSDTSNPWDVFNDSVMQVPDGAVEIMEDGGTRICIPVSCQGKVLECGDCMDNDGDGAFDSNDPECLGPCDNTEGPGLLAGVGGETGGPCKADCYFDFGNGPGNDDCKWSSSCDPLSVAPNFPPEGPTCPYEADKVGSRDCPSNQSQTCADVCRPITPNGCDCFGCCTFDAISNRAPADGGSYVWIGSVVEGTNTSSCTLNDIEDTSACKPCTPVADCNNDCGRCELCVGKNSLPQDCFEGEDPPERCAEGVQVCGLEGDAPCPDGYYCTTGCCVATLI